VDEASGGSEGAWEMKLHGGSDDGDRGGSLPCVRACARRGRQTFIGVGTQMQFEHT
jgi:hypothetical protein